MRFALVFDPVALASQTGAWAGGFRLPCV